MTRQPLPGCVMEDNVFPNALAVILDFGYAMVAAERHKFSSRHIKDELSVNSCAIQVLTHLSQHHEIRARHCCFRRLRGCPCHLPGALDQQCRCWKFMCQASNDQQPNYRCDILCKNSTCFYKVLSRADFRNRTLPATLLEPAPVFALSTVRTITENLVDVPY